MYFTYLTNKLTWNTYFLEKLIVAYVIKNFQSFMEPQCSLPYSQKSITACYPESAESNLHHFNRFLKNHLTLSAHPCLELKNWYLT
jgi:hypothetical protein